MHIKKNTIGGDPPTKPPKPVAPSKVKPKKKC